MNPTIRTVLIVMAAIFAFTAVQAVSSADCSEKVEGTVTAVNKDANTIVVNGTTTVKGIPLVYLANQWNIVFEEGVTQVVITAHLCPLSNDMRACTISVDGGDVIDLPGR